MLFLKRFFGGVSFISTSSGLLGYVTIPISCSSNMMFSEELDDQSGYDGIPWSTPPITVERGKETGLPSDMANITLLVRYK
jgi:hypothetical protein